MRTNLVGLSHFTVRTDPGDTGNSGDRSTNLGNLEVSKLTHSESPRVNVCFSPVTAYLKVRKLFCKNGKM